MVLRPQKRTDAVIRIAFVAMSGNWHRGRKTPPGGGFSCLQDLKSLKGGNMFSLAAPTKVFYLGSDPSLPKPGEYSLSIKGDHLRLQEPMKNKKFGISVPYSQITDVSVSYDIKNKSFSFGKAVAGDLLVGPVGALAGVGRGKKKVEPSLVISYTTEAGQQIQIVANYKHAELLQKKIQKHLS